MHLNNYFDLFKKGTFLSAISIELFVCFREHRIIAKMKTKCLMASEMTFQSLFP